jgi:phosphate regulon transcriptional regulator PhoB
MSDLLSVKTLKILIVDDEKDLVDLMVYNLEREGFQTLRAYDGETALKLAVSKKPDLIILDLMLPGVQGMEVCKKIRQNPETAAMPIIMLTAKGEEIDKVLGLEFGADDYVTKPFSVKEMMARIKAVLRRMEPHGTKEKDEIFEFKELRIDFRSYEVFLGNRKLELSPTEFKLLKFLSHHPGRVYSRDQILDAVWSDESFVEPRTVDVHIRRLRAQIEKDAEEPQYIITVRGVGYKFADKK